MSVGDTHHRTNGRSPKGRAAAALGAQSFTMTIPSIYDEGRKAKERILEALAANRFNDDSIYAIRLAVEEALMNAIKHGNRLDPGKKVHIAAKVTAKQAEIVIEDEGAGFERQSVPDCRDEENLEKCSGRGILMIESYMNRVEWSHGGRRLRMIRKNQEDDRGAR
jgi:serine/threonine-protein kinase RsbW